MTQINFLKSVIKILKNRNIDSIVIKLYNKSPDIDLVVIDKGKYITAQKILLENDFKKLKTLSSIREPEKTMFTSKKYKIHLHSMISWNAIEYIEAKKVWQRKIKKQGLYFPSPEDEILIIAAHSLFENDYITKEELAYYNKLIKKKIDWNYIKKSAKEFNWLDSLNLFQKTINRKNKFRFFELFKVSMNKLLNDIFDLKISQLPRQIISYIIINPLWYYRKKLKKFGL